MHAEDWKKRVRAAAIAARDAKSVNLTELARRVGWSGPMIRRFLNEGVGGDDAVRRLERELSAHGFPPDPEILLARELRTAADLLESGVASDESKTQHLAALIDGLRSGIRKGLRRKQHDPGASN